MSLKQVEDERKRTKEANEKSKGRDEDYCPFTKTGDVGTWCPFTKTFDD